MLKYNPKYYSLKNLFEDGGDKDKNPPMKIIPPPSIVEQINAQWRSGNVMASDKTTVAKSSPGVVKTQAKQEEQKAAQAKKNAEVKRTTQIIADKKAQDLGYNDAAQMQKDIDMFNAAALKSGEIKPLTNQEMSDLEAEHAFEDWMLKPAAEKQEDAFNAAMTIGLVAGAVMAPQVTIPALAAGTAGGAMVDYSVNKYSNGKYNGWGDMVTQYTNGWIPKYLADFTNPGMIIGGKAGGGLGRALPSPYSFFRTTKTGAGEAADVGYNFLDNLIYRNEKSVSSPAYQMGVVKSDVGLQKVYNRLAWIEAEYNKEIMKQNPDMNKLQNLRDEHYEIVSHNPNQLKLTDPITFDDHGNPIPLSLRDNFDNPDIRYVEAADWEQLKPLNKDNADAFKQSLGYVMEESNILYNNIVAERLKNRTKVNTDEKDKLLNDRISMNFPEPFYFNSIASENLPDRVGGVTYPMPRKTATGSNYVMAIPYRWYNMERLLSNINHERRHTLQFLHRGWYDPSSTTTHPSGLLGDEESVLNMAYKTSDLNSSANNVIEKYATNTEMYLAIAHKYNINNNKASIKKIDEMSNDDLIELIESTNGYGKEYAKYYKESKNGIERWQMMAKIRRALKYIPVLFPFILQQNEEKQ